MTEIAKKLIERFKPFAFGGSESNDLAWAKTCALIAIDFAKNLETEKTEDLFLMIPFNDQKQYKDYLEALRMAVRNYGEET